jgi:hypothetical protein
MPGSPWSFLAARRRDASFRSRRLTGRADPAIHDRMPLFAVPDGQPGPWKPVTGVHAAFVSLGVMTLFYLLATAQDGFVFIDFVNLAFHEAGHPLLGAFGETLGLYGGTIGQLAFPCAAAVAFWRQREPVGSAVALVWLFENFLNIARYMADAQAQALPLVGGGEHDWTNIFSRWGVLAADRSIARAVNAMGWTGMIAAWAWLGWRWWTGSGAVGIETAPTRRP